ncbi:hypothetical protein D3C84_1108100 [compost metagenome]
MVAIRTLAANQPQMPELMSAGHCSVNRESRVPSSPVTASWMQVSQVGGMDWAKWRCTASCTPRVAAAARNQNRESDTPQWVLLESSSRPATATGRVSQ